MAAAIRHAARRISVQRAVEPPRLVNTGPVNPKPHGLTADQKKDAAIRMALIDNKTEELYNLVAGFNAKYTVKGSVGQKYTNLMNQLSVQIQPRHDDPGWRSCRRSAIVHDCFKTVGGLFIGYVLGDASFHWYHDGISSWHHKNS